MEVLEFLLSLLEGAEIFWWIGRGLWWLVKGLVWLVWIFVRMLADGARAIGRGLTGWTRRRRSEEDFPVATAAQRRRRWR